jgi:Ca2+/Na+ antiporter
VVGVSRPALLFSLRVGLPVVLFVAGIVILVVVDSSVRWDGWAMCWGSALALLLVTFLVRMGNEGEKERDAEERARAYLAEHGHWPDEPPRR